MVWVNKLAPEFPDYLVKTEDEHGTYYGKNPALATRELSMVANKTASRATFLVTSDEFRQESNRPDDFENLAIKSFKADNSLKFKDGFDDGVYRYTRPIFVVESCLKCHGDPNDAPPELIVKYGGQKAFGYKVGDVRGIISVKLPILSWRDLLPIFSNPIAIILIICAFLLNFLFIQKIIIRRLVNLTNDASEIAKGNLAKSLKYSVPKESNDEIDHVCHSVNLLKKSMDILIKRSNKL
jgi:methyl-accepting chemotaxis protein